MALNDIGLCSRALIRLGASPITSFEDGTAESEIAGALFGPTRDALLSAYPWSFATGQVVLNKLENSPVTDFANAFALPNDYLRATSAGNASQGQGAYYKLVRNALHTNQDEIVLSYIFRPEEEEFPPFFDMALIARLTAEFCIPVTESTSRAEAHYRISDDEYARARQIDAQQDSPNRLRHFPLIDVRN